MVRINLIHPKYLADQHLIAEYNEILMLLGHVKKHGHTKKTPPNYLLGPGHITFFKDKIIYLKNRHNLIKKEMNLRGFVTNKEILINAYPKILHNDWKPNKKDKEIIKARLKEKISIKPKYYRYKGEKKGKSFFINLINKSN